MEKQELREPVKSYDEAFKNELVQLTMRPGAKIKRTVQDFGVSTETLRGWRDRIVGSAEAPAGLKQEDLAARVRQLESHLALAKEERDILNRVARQMKELGLMARKKRGCVPRTTDSRHGEPISINLLLEAETTREINTVWHSDITYIATQEGWLYLAAVLDDCSRKIIGWASAEHMESSLVCAALEQAWRKRGKVAGVNVHADRGAQYASIGFRTALT
jgi:transposase InsO family protein